MEYNFKEIGNRIALERIKAGFKSQQKFLDHLSDKYYFSMSRNTLSAIENGKTKHYDCEFLFILCREFGCEIGYLLCEDGYENKTRKMTDIVKTTGLHPKAISMLNALSSGKGYDDEVMMLISRMITNSQFVSLLLEILENKSYYMAMIETKEEVKNSFKSDDDAFRYARNSIQSSEKYRSNMYSITHIFEEIVKDVTIGPAIIEYYEPQSSTNIHDAKPPIYADLLPKPSNSPKSPK